MKNYLIKSGYYTILFIVLFSASQTKAQAIYPSGLTPYATELHVHGLSNHNGSPTPACMQWQSFYSDTTNTPILWWTDHREVFTQNVTIAANFKNGVYNPSTLAITGLGGSQTAPNLWQGYSNGGTKTVALTNTSIAITMTADSTSTFRYIYFTPQGTKGSLKGSRNWVRPLTSQPKITLDLKPSGFGNFTNAQIQLVLLMSYHYYNGVAKQQSITYNFTSSTTPFSRTLVDSSTLIVNIPVTIGVTNHLVLDLATDAFYMKDGIDNTTNEIRFLVQSKNSKKLTASFSNFKIASTDSVGQSQYQIFKSLGEGYGSRFGINEYIGAEWTDADHLNGFLPDSTTNRECLYKNETVVLGPQYFVDKVHQGGGVVSFNHPFGSSGAMQTQSVQDYRTDTIAQYILNNSAYNADILEVGYTNRGGADLNHHLKLWDILTANKLYLYGDGVNDSHGGTWFTSANNFITWIWAADSTPANLIDGLKSGKSFFGTNVKFTGNKFYFKVGNVGMGARVAATTQTAPLSVKITNAPANIEYRLTQGIIQPGLNVTYLYNDFVFNPLNPPCLSLTEPCFVRIAIYKSGAPILFSNPIVFTEGALPTDSMLCNILPPVAKKSAAAEFEIYPNPTKGNLVLKSNSKVESTQKISLLNSTGRLIKYFGSFDIAVGNSELKFELPSLTNGNYFLLLEDNDSKNTLPFIISN